MKLFLDTEFNGFGGRLMSMALVPEDETKLHFYKELTMNDQLHPWVKENVVPHLILIPCSYWEFQNSLAEYLWTVGNGEPLTIVADWPEDIKHFCEALISGPGMMINVLSPLSFEIAKGLDYQSQVPHNALHDAIGIRKAYVK